MAVAFGAQSIVQDLISGIFIIVENQYDVGEYIKIGDTVGKVEEIGMKTTKISSYNGELLTIPNGKIQTVINYSRPRPATQRRCRRSLRGGHHRRYGGS